MSKMTHHITTIKEQIMEIYAGACVSCSLKTPLSVILGGLAYLLGGQNLNAGIAIVVLISIDMITAMMAEYKNGSPIESRKALKSATKLVVYGLFLSAIHLTEIIVPGTTFLDEAALSFLALTEAISVMENVGKMGYSVPLKLLNKLQDLKETKV